MPLSLALTFGVGCLITVHIAMNARIGALTGNAYMANSVFWFVGCVMSLVLGGLSYEPGFVSRIGRAPAWLLLAGAIGAFIAAFNNAMLPRIGVANLTFFLFLGQVVASVLLATTGVLGAGRDPLTWLRAAGILLVVTGTLLFAYGNHVRAA
jgi:bacterial/archaeal transporter family-2 protein